MNKLDFIAAQFISTTEKEYEDIYNAPASIIKPYNPARDYQLQSPKVNIDVDVLLGGGLCVILHHRILLRRHHLSDFLTSSYLLYLLPAAGAISTKLMTLRAVTSLIIGECRSFYG